MDFYKPTMLFRQNAIKKSKSNPEFYTHNNNKSTESWLLKEQKSSTSILDKACSMNRVKIASNYWKIPDDSNYLTSIAINDSNQEQIAISSGSSDSNLFIYDLNNESISLTHQQTITLPNILNMKWLDYAMEESTLITGHKQGVIHMVSIPEANSNESAKILKRFNHKKHFNNSKTLRDPSIRTINMPNWDSKNSSNLLISQCNENIFLWDLNHRSDLPILKNQHLGIKNFDSSPSSNGIIGLAGDFGIAINDLRAPINEVSMFTPKISKDTKNYGFANNIKWAPYDSNILAASHIDGIVRLWDIRAQESFGSLQGHNDLITSIEWSEESSSDLYTGARDGNIIHWDLNFNEDLNNCCLNEGLDSINYYDNQFLTDEFEIYHHLSKRQCGTLIPAAKNSITNLTSSSNYILSIDGSSYLGLHKKRGLDSFEVEEGTSDMIIDNMLKEFPQTETVSDSGSIMTNSDGESESESNSIFEQTLMQDSSVPSTTNNSPIHNKTKSITSLLNNSENSIDTLVNEEIFNESPKRIVSGSTINEDDLEDQFDFTYNEVLPLNQKQRNASSQQYYHYV
ncbi:putative WD repeat-containing protein [Wickerhamomyces ciferrii]|uniref:WD repeat-containing protein n=1 Tax=Wickerhamomyces ciferrii (strain ATCC 14091 / BCRC 22168 / CBS 111 / JCM 3599 / NBRC 0793 / NRRL Y-1031 F-60-10) TaxID=1206466 RepID=K0KF16_WICCF|nr:putative WD repeat-containing protein [Wickerhamomyces ciferrii]CCH40792.1 putative WD repeat-containing protein [Wickerhamomyces ciferrii]